MQSLYILTIKKCVVLSAVVGVFVGFLVGLTKSLLSVRAHRYVELGMYSIAFDHFRSTFKGSFFFPFVVTISIGVLVAVLFVAYLTLFKTRDRAERFTLWTAIFVATFLSWAFGSYALNKTTWYPPATSLKGILLNLLFTAGCFVVGFLTYNILSIRRELLARVFNVRLALALLSLVLGMEGYSSYKKFSHQGGTNVLLITVDTLRADHLGYSGYGRNTSPNLDMLADDGVVFSNAFVQWPMTTPSLASMLTGTYPHTNGVIGQTGKKMSLNSYFLSLPEILRDNGYNTVGFVSNLYLSSLFNFDQGFETYIEAWEVNGHNASTITQSASDWLETNYKKGKFFLWIHYIDPHAPYAPPEPFARMYVGDALYDETKRVNLIAPDLSHPEIGGVRERARLGNQDVLDYYVAQYDGEIKYVDENVGALLGKMKNLGLYDETLILFTADHGESLGEHNYFFWHGRLPYNDCLRAPLVIKFPDDLAPSGPVHHPVGLIDLAPTVLDFLDLPFPAEGEMEGETLIPLIKGDLNRAPHSVYSEAGYGEGHQKILLKDQWKLIYVPDPSIQKIMNETPFELYNMQDDPRELKNLVEVEPLIAEELTKELFVRMEQMRRTDERPLSESVEVDSKTEEALKSLGYVQ